MYAEKAGIRRFATAIATVVNQSIEMEATMGLHAIEVLARTCKANRWGGPTFIEARQTFSIAKSRGTPPVETWKKCYIVNMSFF